MQVKICGVKRIEEVRTAVAAGATFVGLNFYECSSRYLTIEQAIFLLMAIRKESLPVQSVAIVVNQTLPTLQHLLDSTQIDWIQLCGDEPLETVNALAGRAFKAIRPQTAAEATQAATLYAQPQAPALLVDAYRPEGFGGAGEVGNWQLATTLAAQYPIFLAGGLTPDNVATAVAQVRPWGVDVASGVESAPGVKDLGRIRAFVQAAVGG